MNPWFALVILAQNPTKTDLTRPTHKPTVADSSPVTRAEAIKTFARVEKLIQGVVGPAKFATKTAITASAEPVTRIQVAREFERINAAVEPFVKLHYRPLAIDESRIRAGGAADRNLLIKLVKYGYVGEFAPIASGPKDTLTVKQFGDAIGFYLLRVMDVTHVPQTKWVPYLHGIK